ncbi:MAG: hypothetical protein O2814_07145 [Bacteroidetes bacterium]|nr:hypothetical protein [Bacteroidota bacterium]
MSTGAMPLVSSMYFQTTRFIKSTVSPTSPSSMMMRSWAWGLGKYLSY